jgi:hypothetical protein
MLEESYGAGAEPQAADFISAGTAERELAAVGGLQGQVPVRCLSGVRELR